MPADDKDGYIVDKVLLPKGHCYIVAYQKQPHLRVSVKLPNILDWVSPRVLEKWETEKYDEEEAEREKIELPRIQAKDERRRKRLEKLSRADTPESNSRKRKRIPLDEVPLKIKKATAPGSVKKSVGHPRGPASRNQPVEEEEEITFKSRRQSQHSQQQPSLSASGGGLANRTVLDTDSEDGDSMATDIAIDHRLQGEKIPGPNVESSRSSSPTKSKRKSRSTSKLVDTSRDESQDVSSGPKITPRKRTHKLPASPLPARGAVAGTSSREALKLYEDLERKNNKKPQTLVDKYSHIGRQSQSSFKDAHIGLAASSRSITQVATEDQETSEPEEEYGEDELAADTEPEYEVNKILKHEIRCSEDGKAETWYLIDWVGEWDDTWEPAENVGEGAIMEYEKKKGKKKRCRGGAPGDGEDSDPDSLFVSEMAKAKGKEFMRGQVIDDDDEDDVDDDEVQWQAFIVSA